MDALVRARVLLAEADALGVSVEDLVAASADAPRTRVSMPTVAEWVERITPTFTDGTLGTYKSYWALLVARFGDRPIDEVGYDGCELVVADAVRRAQRDRPGSSGTSSRENCIAALRAFYKRATRAKLVTENYGADRGYQEIDTGQYDQPEDVFLMCGAAVILRREALDQVGVFDDDFFMYYEDTDLSWRLRAAGWDIRYDPHAVVRHLHSASSVEWSPLFTFHVERNRLLTLLKNAPAGMAGRSFARFNLTTLSMIRWALLQALRDRRRPALRPLLLRLRVTGSYLRLLPAMLTKRHRIIRSRRNEPRRLLDHWMQAAR